jgi:hypothetical protein
MLSMKLFLAILKVSFFSFPNINLKKSKSVGSCFWNPETPLNEEEGAEEGGEGEGERGRRGR